MGPVPPPCSPCPAVPGVCPPCSLPGCPWGPCSSPWSSWSSCPACRPCCPGARAPASRCSPPRLRPARVARVEARAPADDGRPHLAPFVRLEVEDGRGGALTGAGHLAAGQDVEAGVEGQVAVSARGQHLPPGEGVVPLHRLRGDAVVVAGGDQHAPVRQADHGGVPAPEGHVRDALPAPYGVEDVGGLAAPPGVVRAGGVAPGAPADEEAPVREQGVAAAEEVRVRHVGRRPHRPVRGIPDPRLGGRVRPGVAGVVDHLAGGQQRRVHRRHLRALGQDLPRSHPLSPSQRRPWSPGPLAPGRRASA